MRGFLAGFLIAGTLGLMGHLLWMDRPPPDPCRACGAGTRCEEGMCVAEQAVAPGPPRRRPHPRSQRTTEEAAPPSPVPLKPGDLRPMTTGDDLGRSEIIDLTRQEGAERELDQDDIDRVFRPVQAAVVACIDAARGEAEVTGRVSLTFRIQRSGAVSGVRLEAPSYLVRRGLYSCVRPVVAPLRFPPSSRGQIVSYPFTIR